jgi:hypothetical protein
MGQNDRPDLMPTTFDGAFFRLVEELGEAMQACGKIGRFGLHPRVAGDVP